MKKTGDVVEDRLSIRRVHEHGNVFKIHFPDNSDDLTAIGIDIVMSYEQLKKLQYIVDWAIAYSCPRCGKATHNHRKHECACDERRCGYCGWSDR